MKMILEFRSRYLAMVEIAAGIRDRCVFGDAIVAHPCWDWESGKFKDRESVTVIEPAPRAIECRLFHQSEIVEHFPR